MTLPPFYGVLEKDSFFYGVEVGGDFFGNPRDTWEAAASDCWHNFFGCKGMMPLYAE